MYSYMYTYLYICVYMCVCLCVWPYLNICVYIEHEFLKSNMPRLIHSNSPRGLDLLGLVRDAGTIAKDASACRAATGSLSFSELVYDLM